MWPGHEEPLDWRAKRWLLVERTGWTLDVIDDLDATDYLDGMAVLDALDSVRRARSGGGSAS